MLILALPVSTAACGGSGDDGPKARVDVPAPASAEGSEDPAGGGTTIMVDLPGGPGRRVALGITGSEVCFDVAVRGAGSVSAVHVHEVSAPDVPPQLQWVPPVPAEDVRGCADAEPAVREGLQDAPADLFVDVHTTGVPDGSLRGPLS